MNDYFEVCRATEEELRQEICEMLNQMSIKRLRYIYLIIKSKIFE